MTVIALEPSAWTNQAVWLAPTVWLGRIYGTFGMYFLKKRFRILQSPLSFKRDITCLIGLAGSARSSTVERAHHASEAARRRWSLQQPNLPLPGSPASLTQRKCDHRGRNIVFTAALPARLDVRISFGSASGSGGRGLIVCHDCHICSYPHLLKNGLDRVLGWPEWLGSPHMPADFPCQRQCASHGGR